MAGYRYMKKKNNNVRLQDDYSGVEDSARKRLLPLWKWTGFTIPDILDALTTTEGKGPLLELID